MNTHSEGSTLLSYNHSIAMEVKYTVVDTDARPVLCILCTVKAEILVGFQNSIPCKEELVNASYGLFE